MARAIVSTLVASGAIAAQPKERGEEGEGCTESNMRTHIKQKMRRVKTFKIQNPKICCSKIYLKITIGKIKSREFHYDQEHS